MIGGVNFLWELPRNQRIQAIKGLLELVVLSTTNPFAIDIRWGEG
jgi:hypothetical protein